MPYKLQEKFSEGTITFLWCRVLKNWMHEVTLTKHTRLNVSVCLQEMTCVS